MYDRDRAIDHIETALRLEPFCLCGQSTTIVARDGAIRLECPTLTVPRGTVGRLIRLVVAPTHVSRVVIDGELAAVAA